MNSFVDDSDANADARAEGLPFPIETHGTYSVDQALRQLLAIKNAAVLDEQAKLVASKTCKGGILSLGAFDEDISKLPK